MLNHYFANRQAILTAALVYVTERSQDRYERAIAGMPAGRERLEALLDSVLGEDAEALETCHVWINVLGEAVRLPELRRTVEERLQHWYRLLTRALEGVAPPDRPGEVPWSWRVDSVIFGLVSLALTSEAELNGRMIRDEVVRMALAASALEDRVGADGDLAHAFAD
jgi:AcrR family transcriptional regulator